MKRLTRRQFLKLGGMGSGVALATLAGCAPPPTAAPAATAAPQGAPTSPPATSAPAPTQAPAPTEAPAPTAAEPKVLRIRLYGDIQNLDPAFLVSENDNDVGMNVISGLVTYGANSYDIVNDLAESITPSDDGLEVTFKLREGVQWQNGYGEVTTDDVKFSYERIANPDMQAAYHDDWATLDHVEVIDKYNGKIVFSEPFAPLWHSTLPVGSGWVLCKKYVEEVGNDKFATQIMGSGPYLYSEWNPKQQVTLKRNPDYFGTPPYYDEIHFIPIEDDKAAEVALQAGELDFSRISAASFDQFAADPNFETAKLPSLRYRWIGMNVENPKLQDINVRQAIRYAIDVPSILQAAYLGQVKQEYGLVPEGLIGYWADAPQYQRDVAKAQDFMSKAGVSSLDLRMDIQDTTEYRTWAEIAQQNLKDIGINLTINPLDSSSYWSIGDGDAGKNVELFSSNYSMEPDPSWATVWFTTDQIGVWNWMRWSSPEYDDLHKQGLVTIDNTKREQIYIKMQQLWDEACHTIWITNGSQTYAYSPAIKPALTPNGLMQPLFFEAA
jgi:peptide/nickel transport system substrate-binding protein